MLPFITVKANFFYRKKKNINKNIFFEKIKSIYLCSEPYTRNILKGLIFLTGEEYATFLQNINDVKKVEWVVKGEPLDADVLKLRVFADTATFDMIIGYPKTSGIVEVYDRFLISYVLWRMRKTYGEKKPFKVIADRDALVDEINQCIQLAAQNSEVTAFNQHC